MPPECEALADEVSALGSRADALAGEAASAVGIDAWTQLAKLAALRQELDRKRAALDACVRAHQGGLPCELVTMDAGGAARIGDRLAHLWDLGTPIPTLKETVPVQGAGFSLVRPISGGALAITVTAAEAGPGKGPDFRSGVIPAPPPANQRLRLEVVLGPIVTVTGEDISRWLSGVTIPPWSVDVAGVGRVRVSVSAVTGTLAHGAIQLRAAGTVAVPPVSAQDSPFSASAGLGVVPSTSPVDPPPAEPTIVARPTVELAGPLAIFGSALNLALSAGIFDSILDQMRPILDRELAAMIARAFSLLHLPPATLSIRELAIEPSAITFEPALGAVGTGLSSFQRIRCCCCRPDPLEDRRAAG